MHIRTTVVCICGVIFKQNQHDIQLVVNTGFEGGASVFHLLFVYRSFLCSLRGTMINDGCRQFVKESTSPLIETLPGFLLLSYFESNRIKHFANLSQCQKLSFQEMSEMANSPTSQTNPDKRSPVYLLQGICSCYSLCTM